MSAWLVNPELKKILADFHSVSESSRAIGLLARELPELVEKERALAIDQLMDRVAEERKSTVQMLISEEERLGGLLSELHQTITEAGQLISGADTLAERMGFHPGSSPEFRIDAYGKAVEKATVTIRELQSLLETTGRLISNSDLKELLHLLNASFDNAEAGGEQLVDHTFVRVIYLLLIWMVVYIIGRLIVRLLTDKLFAAGKEGHPVAGNAAGSRHAA